jgi:deazaflavin-dependent oxidoreductase (nitroreductase family)
VTLLLLTTTGAKSGQKRINPLIYLLDGERLFIFAAKGGSPTNPDWYHNLVAHPGAADYEKKTTRKIPVVELVRRRAHGNGAWSCSFQMKFLMRKSHTFLKSSTYIARCILPSKIHLWANRG